MKKAIFTFTAALAALGAFAANTYYGQGALESASAYDTSAYGEGAGRGSTRMNNSVLIGRNSGYGMDDCRGCVCIGSGSMNNASGNERCVAIGANEMEGLQYQTGVTSINGEQIWFSQQSDAFSLTPQMNGAFESSPVWYRRGAMNIKGTNSVSITTDGTLSLNASNITVNGEGLQQKVKRWRSGDQMTAPYHGWSGWIGGGMRWSLNYSYSSLKVTLTYDRGRITTVNYNLNGGKVFFYVPYHPTVVDVDYRSTNVTYAVENDSLPPLIFATTDDILTEKRPNTYAEVGFKFTLANGQLTVRAFVDFRNFNDGDQFVSRIAADSPYYDRFPYSFEESVFLGHLEDRPVVTEDHGLITATAVYNALDGATFRFENGGLGVYTNGVKAGTLTFAPSP